MADWMVLIWLADRFKGAGKLSGIVYVMAMVPMVIICLTASHPPDRATMANPILFNTVH